MGRRSWQPSSNWGATAWSLQQSCPSLAPSGILGPASPHTVRSRHELTSGHNLEPSSTVIVIITKLTVNAKIVVVVVVVLVLVLVLVLVIWAIKKKKQGQDLGALTHLDGHAVWGNANSDGLSSGRKPLVGSLLLP